MTQGRNVPHTLQNAQQSKLKGQKELTKLSKHAAHNHCGTVIMTKPITGLVT